MSKSVLEENFLLSEQWRQLQRKFPLVAEIIAEVHANSVEFNQYVADVKLVNSRLDGMQKQIDEIKLMLHQLGIQRIASQS